MAFLFSSNAIFVTYYFQIVTFIKFNNKILRKMNGIVQNRLFLQNFPYY